MVHGVVAGLKNGELVMAGVVGGDCRDKMADRCQGLIGKSSLLFIAHARQNSISQI